MEVALKRGDILSDSMKHYGIPGMHWGHRKAQTLNPHKELRKKKNIKRAISLTMTLVSIAYTLSRPEFRNSVKQGLDFAKSIDWNTTNYTTAKNILDGLVK